MSYFNAERKAAAVKALKIIYQSAEKAGFKDRLFVGFGLCLGIVRENDFIGHDDDMDMCIQADKITTEQELAYYRYLDEEGMFTARRRMALKPDAGGFTQAEILAKEHDGKQHKNRFCWFSLRRRHGEAKCCNWFFFKHEGYYWHTKGSLWIDTNKFKPQEASINSNDDAVLKGIPEYMVDELITVPFYDTEVRIPKMYGTALDFWYPGWRVPKKGGASAKKIVCVVKRWEDKKTWTIRENR